jgi:hypothetical protein
MPQAHNSTFTTSDWVETDIEGMPGSLRQTTVRYTVTYIGDVAGTSVVSYVMVYKPDQTVEYVGYETFEGTIGSCSGTVVFESRGTFDGNGATADLTVVPGTATGDLAGHHITGNMHAPKDGDGSLMLVEHDIKPIHESA